MCRITNGNMHGIKNFSCNLFHFNNRAASSTNFSCNRFHFSNGEAYSKRKPKRIVYPSFSKIQKKNKKSFSKTNQIPGNCDNNSFNRWFGVHKGWVLSNKLKLKWTTHHKKIDHFKLFQKFAHPESEATPTCFPHSSAEHHSFFANLTLLSNFRVYLSCGKTVNSPPRRSWQCYSGEFSMHFRK